MADDIHGALREAIRTILPDVECVLGWGSGPDPLRSAPLFMKSPEDVERFRAGELAVNNLAVFLPEYAGRKVGIVVKGCDSRSVVQLISETLVKREEVVIIGYPCRGVVDVAKIAAAIGLGNEDLEAGLVERAEVNGDTVSVTVRGETKTFPFKDVMAAKCSICRYPNAVLHDVFIGEKAEAREDSYADLEKYEAMSLEERFRFWEKEMERCKNVFEVEQISHPTIQHQYEQAELAVKQAQDAYDLALQQYDVTWNKTLQGIDTAQDNIDTSVISSNQTVSRLSLEQLEKKLDDAIVTAPISGTVTAVYAEEGATPSGLLFIIEDTDKLKIETTVKEYDLPSVKIGQKVEIKSDGIGDRVITGKVEKIAPTAVKAAAGSANSSGSVEFAVEISVDEPHEGLLIGMKARVSIVLQEALGVYGIPYDAVLTDPDGSTYVLVAEAGEKGYTAKRIPVQVGMESDFYVEISGDGLTDGLLVITNPAGITEGMPVPVSQPEGV